MSLCSVEPGLTSFTICKHRHVFNHEVSAHTRSFYPCIYSSNQMCGHAGALTFAQEVASPLLVASIKLR